MSNRIRSPVHARWQSIHDAYNARLANRCGSSILYFYLFSEFTRLSLYSLQTDTIRLSRRTARNSSDRPARLLTCHAPNVLDPPLSHFSIPRKAPSPFSLPSSHAEPSKPASTHDLDLAPQEIRHHLSRRQSSRMVECQKVQRGKERVGESEREHGWDPACLVCQLVPWLCQGPWPDPGPREGGEGEGREGHLAPSSTRHQAKGRARLFESCRVVRISSCPLDIPCSSPLQRRLVASAPHFHAPYAHHNKTHPAGTPTCERYRITHNPNPDPNPNPNPNPNPAPYPHPNPITGQE